MTELRPYQQQVVANTREALLSCNSVIIPIPTGGGKTVVGADLIRQEVEAGGYVVVLVHRTELVDQMVGKLFDIGLDAGVIKAGFKPRPDQRVQVCSVQTLHARAVRRQSIEMPKATLVVADECHHARARTWREILEALPDAKIIGLSATPARGDGRGLGNIFDRIIDAPQTADLIALGFLVPTRVYAPHDPDLRGVQTKAGDYVESQLADRMDKAELTGDIVEHWLRHANRQPTIAFCCNVAHSKHACDQFRLTGVLAEHIDASTPSDVRKSILTKLAKGEIEVVCNCGILTEGFDAPNVGCIIMARPTRSTVLFWQMIGRGLRPTPGKDSCLVLDHSGAVFRHGFAEDRVEWTLHEDRRAEVPAQASRAAHHEKKLCTCPECSAVRMQGQPCTACGWRPQPKAQAVEVANGDLYQVDRTRRTQQDNWTQETRLEFYQQLLYIANERGYQAGWASHKYKEKFGVWPAKKFVLPMVPEQAVRSWVKSRQIAYARGMARRGAA